MSDLQSSTEQEPVQGESSSTSSEFKALYRYAGELKVYAIQKEPTRKSFSEIDSRSLNFNRITHMAIELGENMVSLHLICPAVTHLDIRNIKKCHNLECLSKLRELQMLDISYNDFSSGLPSSVFEIKSLQELYLIGCNLTDLPESLAKLQCLTALHVSENDFSSGLPLVICELASLQRLYASKCQLSSLPPMLSQLKDLLTLDIPHNDFAAGLPPVICELITLTRLYIRHCGLTDLPESFEQLARLEVVNLAYNDFTVIPSVIYRMDSLTKLHLFSNKDLNTIDRKLLNLTKLETIVCEECESLRSPPFEVCQKGLPSIKKYFSEVSADTSSERTYLEPTSISDKIMRGADSMLSPPETGFRIWCRHDGEESINGIPNNPNMSIVEDYKDIIEAVGSYNITHMRVDLGDEMIPLDQICPLVVDLEIHNIASNHNLDCLRSLKALRTLDISSNNFGSGLPLVICDLKCIEKLKLKKCSLREVPEKLTNLDKLQTLDVSANDFGNNFPHAISEMKSLNELDISECHLTCLPERLNLEKLHTLYVVRNDFSSGLPTVLSGMTHLQHLYLGECKLSELPEEMSNLSHLVTLNLSFNDFSSKLPPVISKLTLLVKLHLIHCKLTALPDSLSALTSLQWLNMSFNDFIEFPPVVYKLLNLHTIHVWGNRLLQTVKPEFMNLTELQVMSCDECSSLVSPPYVVCAQGLLAMKQYFEQLKEGVALVVPVAVVGNTNEIRSSSDPIPDDITEVDIFRSKSEQRTKTCDDPLPANLHDTIERLCLDLKVEDPIWYQAPTNCRKIIIMGVGAPKLQQKLEIDFPKLFFEIIESGPHHTIEYSRSAVTIEKQERMSDDSTKSWEFKEWATCDLILQGDEPAKNSKHDSLFAVTSAHLMLTKDQRARIHLQEDNSVSIKEMRTEIKSLQAKQKYFLKPSVDNTNISVLNHPPIFSYRHYSNGKAKCGARKCDLPTSTDRCPHVFLNDIAIFRMDHQAIEKIKTDIAEDFGRYADMCFDRILPECSEEVKAMMEPNTEIYVGPFSYETWHYRQSERTIKIYADHITFASIEGRNPLKDGDSGSIVYIKGSNGERYAVGKVFGRFGPEGADALYQAILLSPALKDVVQDYPQHATGLRLFDVRSLRG